MVRRRVEVSFALLDMLLLRRWRRLKEGEREEEVEASSSKLKWNEASTQPRAALNR